MKDEKIIKEMREWLLEYRPMRQFYSVAENQWVFDRIMTLICIKFDRERKAWAKEKKELEEKSYYKGYTKGFDNRTEQMKDNHEAYKKDLIKKIEKIKQPGDVVYIEDVLNLIKGEGEKG